MPDYGCNISCLITSISEQITALAISFFAEKFAIRKKGQATNPSQMELILGEWPFHFRQYPVNDVSKGFGASSSSVKDEEGNRVQSAVLNFENNLCDLHDTNFLKNAQPLNILSTLTKGTIR